MAFVESQVADLYIEKIRKRKPLVELVPRASRFWKWFNKAAEVEVTSNNDLRINVRTGGGAAMSYTNFDTGAVGLGGSPIFHKMTSAPKAFKVVSQISLAGMKHTDTQEKAVEDVFAYALADHAKVMASVFDSMLFSQTGVFATVTTGTTGTSLVVSDVRHFAEGMPLVRYDPTFATQRTSASGKDPRVVTISRLTKTITISEGWTGGTPATSDVLMLGGLAGASPTKLFSIYDFHENAATGTVGGLSRATYDQLRTAKASAGSLLNVVHGYAVQYAMNAKRPEVNLSKDALWVGSAAAFAGNAIDVTQRQQIMFSGKQDSSSGGRKVTDYSFDILSDGVFVGIPTMLANHAKDDRIDLMLKKNWGKQVTVAPEPHDFGGGKRLWPVIEGTDFTPTFQYLFAHIAEFQVYNVDPGSEAFIDQISLPAGWSTLA